MEEDKILAPFLEEMVNRDLSTQRSPTTLSRAIQDRASLKIKKEEQEKSLIESGEYVTIECLDQNVFKAADVPIRFNDFTKELTNTSIEATELNDATQSLFNISLDVDALGGPHSLIKINEIPNMPELSSVLRPYKSENSQNSVDQKARLIAAIEKEVVVPIEDAGRLIRTSLDKQYLEILSEIENPSEEDKQFYKEERALIEEQMFLLLSNCPRSVFNQSQNFYEEVPIVGEASDPGPPAPTLYRYTGDAINTRRPAGTFLIIELVNKNDERQNILGANGQVVTSLKLNMMPDSLSVNSSKIINRYQTLTRWVEEHWGDDLDQIGFSGSTFSFIDFTNSNGLTVAEREMTVPYKELRHLAALFQTNGIQYQPSSIVSTSDGSTAALNYNYEPRTFFTTSKSDQQVKIYRHPRAGMVKEQYKVRITHDWFRVWGIFDSFDVVEDSGAPYKFTYSCEFSAEKAEWL
jgi:hypothetical protein